MRREKHIWIMAAIATFVLAACGNQPNSSESTPKIIGGKEVQDTDSRIFKSTVALTFWNGGDSFCTGTIISEKHIVTAAHCLTEIPHNIPIAVRFGNPGLDSAKLALRRVQYKVPHEDYRLDELEHKIIKVDNKAIPAYLVQSPNDIALLTLKSTIPSWAAPVDILPASEQLLKGQKVTLAGFGWDQVEVKTVKTYKGIEVVENGSGGNILRSVESAVNGVNGNAKEVYFKARDKNSCKGDSGGPAYIEGDDGELKLIGATSRGRAGCDDIAIYTDVRRFTSWIEDTIAGQ